VRADDVTIQDLTVEGDNPALAGGSNVGGANIDARNGIITDNTTGSFDNLHVQDVAVRNIFLRGIYSFHGDGLHVAENTVDNVHVGLAQFGRAVNTANTIFDGNTVRGGNRPDSVGVYVTTWDIGFGTFDASATLTGNSIQGFDDGVLVERTSDALAGQT